MKAKTHKIIATFSRKFQGDSEWNIKEYAEWVDVTDIDGTPLQNIYCNYGNIMYSLRPNRLDRFIIEYKNQVGNRFEFPVSFKGVNNKKDMFYSYKQRELIPVGSIEVINNVLSDVPDNYHEKLKTKVVSLKGKFIKYDFIGLGRDSRGCIFEIIGDKIEGIERFVVSENSLKKLDFDFRWFEKKEIVEFEFMATCYIFNCITNGIGRVLGCRGIKSIK